MKEIQRFAKNGNLCKRVLKLQTKQTLEADDKNA
jgi:hypothetical protein